MLSVRTAMPLGRLPESTETSTSLLVWEVERNRKPPTASSSP